MSKTFFDMLFEHLLLSMKKKTTYRYSIVTYKSMNSAVDNIPVLRVCLFYFSASWCLWKQSPES